MQPDRVKLFDPRMLSAALDDATFPVLDDLMSHFGPEAPFLTFGALGVARSLTLYGRTVLADRDAFYDPFGGVREEGIEVRIAGPEDPLAFPPRRFGLVHLRWVPVGGNVIPNAVRWLKPGGVLLVEAADTYPGENLPRGPYQAVASAMADRLNSPSALGAPALLIKHGLQQVGCKHQLPATSAFQTLFQNLVEQGMPWSELLDQDVRDWVKDPVATTPSLMNVISWGVKPAR
jgi:hypothetical protein